MALKRAQDADSRRRRARATNASAANRRRAPHDSEGITLAALRGRTGKTQVDVAAASGVSQIEISRAERRRDHRVSSLRRYINALGGRLEIYARFANELVRIRGV